LQQIDNLNFIAAAVEADRLEAPDALPAGSGILRGYVRADNLVSDLPMMGNLEITANFDNGKVKTKARGFTGLASRGTSSSWQDRQGTNVNGKLRGRGTITATAIESALAGDLTLVSNGVVTTVDGTIAGNVYLDGQNLLLHGDLTGTLSRSGESDSNIEGGAFYAVENR
ncbi:MAG: hypothetical protein GDA49_06720, partial [Rhodospirillales bacterium]|nr:hypothetical protein [Rhodospirillales bacterium]MBC6440091.1 hypothetical protein [Rhodospirillales bacterium]